MSASALPSFRYHPNPFATGSLVATTDVTCAICGRARGWRYTGPQSHPGERVELCPWCIADGSASRALDATFTEVERPESGVVPQAVVDEVERRTPGFIAWQEPRWLVHCADAAAFLGLAGWPELQNHPGAIEMLLHEHDGYGWSAEDSREFVESLGVDHDATAYLFRCLHCGSELAYSDMS